MQFRLKRLSKPIINIAPMVDVLFLLLIFFMVTSTFVEQPSINLDLPSTKYAQSGKINELQLMITRYGKIYLRDEIVNMGELEGILAVLADEMEEKVLVLKADKDVPYGTVIKVMDAANGAGMHKIVAPTILKEEETIRASGSR